MTYEEATRWLYSTQLFGIKLGLGNIHRLCAALGTDTGAPKIIHVAGTNGKGSVCAMAESVARASGLRTGLFTSPHLVSFCERVRVDGIQAGEADTADLINLIKEHTSGWDPHPTFFEITTAVALRHFQDRKVEVVLLETGMGGRLDATNVVSPAACAITKIGLDHQQWLGDTLEAIASEKAGILKPGVPAVTVPQKDEVMTVLQSTAEKVGAPLATAGGLPQDYTLSLEGPHQRTNASLAISALRAAGISPYEKAIRSGLAGTGWPGRFQRFPQGFIVDGAHNPDAARALAMTWRTAFGEKKGTVIFGAVSSKDITSVLSALEPITERFVFTRPDSPRACDPAIFETSVPSETTPDLTTALRRITPSPETPVLIAGSLYLVGEAVAHLGETPHLFEPSAQ